MTQEEIIEGNKLIAEWMGYNYYPNEHIQGWAKFRGESDPVDEIANIFSKETALQYCDNDAPSHWNLPQVVDSNFILESNIKYHTSWDWLMPVVEKIATEHELVRIVFGNVKTYCKINNSHIRIINIEEKPIEATFKAVVQFINWLNSNPPKQ